MKANVELKCRNCGHEQKQVIEESGFNPEILTCIRCAVSGNMWLGPLSANTDPDPGAVKTPYL